MAPSGLQLDLLTAILRLEQAAAEMRKHTAAGQDFAEYLILERVITCDVPRLRSHLDAETLAWYERDGHPARSPDPPPALSSGERDAVMRDLGMLLEALGLGNFARPDSPHDVMMTCVAEAARLKQAERDRARSA